VTLAVKLYAPGAVVEIVLEKLPADVRERFGGREPLISAQVYGVVPPDAVNVAG
jgi:hypothetical protein